METPRTTRAFAATVTAGAVWLALAPAPAGAQSGCEGTETVPPGNSEVDQYAETVPDACGERPVGGGSEDPGAVPPGTAAELEALGQDGEAALALARSTAPRATDDAKAIPVDPGEDDDGGIGDVLAGVLDAIGGSGSGMGVLLPLLLAGVLVAGIAYAIRQRRA